MKAGPPLAVEAMHHLADLLAAGYGLVPALDALPRRSMPARIAHHLDREVAGLRAGSPLPEALDHLGLELTAVAIHSAQANAAEVVRLVRADAEARSEAQELRRKLQLRGGLFGVFLAMLSLMVGYVAFAYVPGAVKELTGNMPESWELPPVLLHFERFRDLWLGLGAGLLLVLAAAALLWTGLFGDRGLRPMIQDLRLQLPFFRSHAVNSGGARLLEALAHEQTVGVAAAVSVRRLEARERVPRIRESLGLIAARLEAGDSWQSCLRGTLFETPILDDLAGLSGQGANPVRGWRWGAARHRELALRDLRRGLFTAAAIVVIPSTLYMLVLLQAASVTATVAQVEGVRQQIELLSQEVEGMIQRDDERPSSRPAPR